MPGMPVEKDDDDEEDSEEEEDDDDEESSSDSGSEIGDGVDHEGVEELDDGSTETSV